jgi:glycosyltransferase involved in cell wall biosynthesis
MRGLRFCFLSTFYPPFNFGGDGIGIRRLAHGLARRGHHVTIVHDVDAYRLLAKRPDPQPLTEPDNVEVVGLTSRLGPVSCLLTQQTGRPIIHGPKIRRIMGEGRFHVVNFHNISLAGGPGVLPLAGSSLRLYMAHEHWLVCPMHVLWRHGRERCSGRQCIRCSLRHRRPPQLYRMTGMMERHLEEVDTFIAMSEFSREKHAEFGFEKTMEVLPHFLPDPVLAAGPAEEFPSPHDRPYFLFVGRLEKIKGLEDVIPIFREYEGADLLIAGDGTYAAELKRLGAGLDRVRFLGRVSPEGLRAYYRNALALIVPSICFETFGIILIEAFSNATPVVARRLGPFPEIVEQSGGGELFWTADELKAALRRLQRDPTYRDQLAASAHTAFERYWTESAVVPKYLDIVRRTALGRGRSDIVDILDATEAA